MRTRTTVSRFAALALALAVGASVTGCSIIGGIINQATGNSLENSTAFTIKVGDCFTEPTADDNGLVSDIAQVKCSEAHDNEAYGAVDLPDGEFPGDDATLSLAEGECSDRFFDFIGADSTYEGSLNYSYLYPSEASWKQGDREILCYLYDEEGQSTGSLKGAAS